MNDNIYKNHELKMLNRNSLYISGIKKIENFDNNEFYLDSVMGKVIIKGSDLETVLIDTDKGEVKIKGRISSITYSNKGKDAKESIFTKLFK